MSRVLSRDEELSAVARLFAEPPAPPARLPPSARHRVRPRVVLAVLAAALAFGTGCVVASVGGPGPVTVGTLLVLGSAAIPVTVLVRRHTVLSRAPGRCR